MSAQRREEQQGGKIDFASTRSAEDKTWSYRAHVGRRGHRVWSKLGPRRSGRWLFGRWAMTRFDSGACYLTHTMEEVDAMQYRRLVGSLCYLAHTRPDLTFSVGYVSRFIQRPTTEHQQAVKRIIRYITGTLDHGLHYPRCPGEAHLVRYSDSNHTDDIDTSKSTSGILFFFGKCLVSWQSVKQQVVALSSCEAE
jgi:hypothetical protein